jgi:hypothetical protein
VLLVIVRGLPVLRVGQRDTQPCFDGIPKEHREIGDEQRPNLKFSGSASSR